MSIKKAWLISLTGLLVLPLALGGCATQVSAQEIANDVILAYPNVDTYKMDMDMTMSMNVETNTEQMKMDMNGDITASIDNSTQEMHMTMDMVASIPGKGQQNISQDMYMVNGKLYMKMSVPGVDQWMKMDISDELRASQNQLEQQVELLKNATEITKVGEEVVEGVKCYILQIKPDMASLFNWVLSQRQELSSEVDLNNVDFAKMFKSISLKEWVAKDSSLPIKAIIEVTMEILPQDMGAGDGETGKITMDLQAQVRYYDYDKPVIIELPQAALNAPSIPSK